MTPQSHVPLTRDLVLIGGGHCHALVLRMWAMRPMPGVRLTVIDPRPVAPYTGMLPGHVAGHYSRDEIEIDLVRLARFAGARLILGAADRIDPNAQVIFVGGREIAYDVASVDIGITGDLPGVTGFADHGVPAKPFVHFAAGWDRFRRQMAVRPEQTTEQDIPRVAVIGAGLGGVELALAMRHALGTGPRISVIGSRGITGAGAGLARRLRAALRAADVAVITGRVVSVDAVGATLADGARVAAQLCVGAAGATPQAWLRGTPLPLQDGFIKVGASLQVDGYPTLFAAGDCAHLSHAPRPKAGVYAVRAAPVLFANLRSMLAANPKQPDIMASRRLRAFHPQKRFLRLVSLGGKRAVAEKYPGLPMAPAGRLIWAWKDRIDRAFMAKLTDLPDMIGVLDADRAAKGAAEGVADILRAAPLCAGCGAKVGRNVLGQVIADLPRIERDDVLTGPGDDAAVLRMGDTFQVLSTDHLRAFTDDPGLLAQIAAQHALGDVRAMGADAQGALAQIILPRGSDQIQARMLADIMQAAGAVFQNAGAVILGGHTTMGAELSIGFTVTGVVAQSPIGLDGAGAGDRLILTGAIGSGVLLAGEMQKRARGRDIADLWRAMACGQDGHLAAPMLRAAHAMTDVTGFGLAGHLMAICRASGVGARLDLDRIAVFDGALDLAGAGIASSLFRANRDDAPVFYGRGGAPGPRFDLLHDPQTAGGLLACVSAQQADDILAKLRGAGVRADQIGEMVEGPVAIVAE